MLDSSRWIIFWLLFFCEQFHFTVACSEHAVKRAIFDGYDNHLRPVKNQSTITYLRVSTEIYSILSINEQDETIELLTWSTLKWEDEFLSWNATQFDDCEMINTMASNVWLPDYIFYSTLENFQIVANELLYAIIYSNGTIIMSLPLHTTLRCPMDITEFPFDTQTCEIVAGTWMYPGDRVVLRLLNDFLNSTSVLMGNSEFETISFTVEEFYNTDSLPVFSELKYTLVLKRRPEYYLFVLLLPSFLLTTLCIIGIFTPSSSEGNRGEKMTLGLTTLLSMAVILKITTDAMPKSGKGLPLLGYYVLYEIGVCSLSTVLSTIIIFVHERANTENWDAPVIVHRIASIPSPCECIRRAMISGKKTAISNNFDGTSSSKENLIRNGQVKIKGCNANSSLNSTMKNDQILVRLQEIISKMDEYLKNLKNKEEKIHVWTSALHKFDLFLLISLLVANSVLTVSVLF